MRLSERSVGRLCPVPGMARPSALVSLLSSSLVLDTKWRLFFLQPKGLELSLVFSPVPANYRERRPGSGLHFLWSKHLVHRDLKPQNLLLTAPRLDATLKIADFGFARHLAKASMAETICGSPLYMVSALTHAIAFTRFVV